MLPLNRMLWLSVLYIPWSIKRLYDMFCGFIINSPGFMWFVNPYPADFQSCDRQCWPMPLTHPEQVAHISVSKVDHHLFRLRFGAFQCLISAKPLSWLLHLYHRTQRNKRQLQFHNIKRFMNEKKNILEWFFQNGSHLASASMGKLIEAERCIYIYIYIYDMMLFLFPLCIQMHIQVYSSEYSIS